MSVPTPDTELVYHCAGVLLAPGSVVLRGNWGRVLHHFGAAHSLFKREMGLEAYRSRKRPELVSRLEAIFACPTEAAARKFITSQGSRASDVVYEAEIVGEARPRFAANYVDVDHAAAYWGGVAPGHPSAELVIDGDLSIIRMLP